MQRIFIFRFSIHMAKRNDYITWDEYFMGVALLSGRRSKDPSTQVGACIVNNQNKIVGAGYNGLPSGCSDEDFPWEKTGDFLQTKYPYVCHAELNAILNNIGMDLSGCRIYTALFPCNECSKAIIQAGIKEVIYLSDKYNGSEVSQASKRMLDTAGVSYRKVVVNRSGIELSFDESTVWYRKNFFFQAIKSSYLLWRITFSENQLLIPPAI